MNYNLGRVLPIFKGEYDNNTRYSNLDVVYYNGSSYVAKGDTKGNLPTDDENWQPVAMAGVLSPEQMAAFNAIERTHSNVLILGSAGTGKSTFVNYLKSATAKRVVCACPTAVAALNISGATIHSLFQIAPRDFIFPEFYPILNRIR